MAKKAAKPMPFAQAVKGSDGKRSKMAATLAGFKGKGFFKKKGSK